MTDKPVYYYADGSGNVYMLNGNVLTYDPVTPAESSTGTYSGGEPKMVTLTSEQVHAVIHVLERGMGKTIDQIANREKGTGEITIRYGKEQRRCILRMGSDAITEIETLLKKYLD
jgi:hypothetical protein